MSKKKQVPKALSYWFVVHFIADLFAAVPLFLFPEQILGFFGWENVSIIFVRLVAAALFGIGIESLIGRNASIYHFKGMLNLKIIWSGMAVAAVIVSILQGAPTMGWIIFAIFFVFHLVWWYWRIRVAKILGEKWAASVPVPGT